MKKIRAILLIMGVMAILGGCALQPQEEIPLTIKIWHYYNGPQKDSFDALVAKYNETVGLEQNVVIEVACQGNIADLNRELVVAAKKQIGAQSMPTVFLSYPDMAYSIDAITPLLALDQYFSRKELDEYVDSFLREGYIDGKLKIFPVAKSTEVMMINKTFWEPFAKASGYTYKDLTTWEDLAKVAQQYYYYTDSLTTEPNDGKALLGRDSIANYLLIGSKQLEHPIIAAEKQALQFDKKTLHKLWEEYYIPFVKGYYFSYGRFSADDAKVGDVIFSINSTTGVPYFPSAVVVGEQTVPIEIEVLPIPNFKGVPDYAVQQGAGMAVVVNEDEKINQAAVDFIRWFTESTINTDFSMSSLYVPVKKEAISLEKLADYATAHSHDQPSPVTVPTLETAIAQFNQSRLYYQPYIENGFAIRTALQKQFLEHCKSGRQLVEQRIKEGEEPEQAYAEYTTKKVFDEFYNRLVEEIKKLE